MSTTFLWSLPETIHVYGWLTMEFLFQLIINRIGLHLSLRTVPNRSYHTETKTQKCCFYYGMDFCVLDAPFTHCTIICSPST